MYFDLKYGFLFSFSFSFVKIFSKNEKHIKVYNNSILFTVMSGGIFYNNIYLELCDYFHSNSLTLSLISSKAFGFTSKVKPLLSLITTVTWQPPIPVTLSSMSWNSISSTPEITKSSSFSVCGMERRGVAPTGDWKAWSRTPANSTVTLTTFSSRWWGNWRTNPPWLGGTSSMRWRGSSTLTYTAENPVLTPPFWLPLELDGRDTSIQPKIF